MSSYFQFQATNLISAMASCIAPSAHAQQQNDTLHNFAPNQTDAAQSSRIQLPEVENRPDHKSIRDFGKFIAQLESPSASAFERFDLHRTRLALSERSLTYADFRHAVDHQIDHASSIWQNN